jgi:hypothetical protein
MKSHVLNTIPVVMTAVLLVLTGCETPTSSLEGTFETSADGFLSPEFASSELAEVLTQELDLTAAQQASIETEMRRHDGPDVHPHGLWIVAARLQDSIGERQKVKLYRAADRYKDQHLHKLVGVYGPCQVDQAGHVDRAGHDDRPAEISFRIIADLLTDGQRAEIRTILARYHEQIEAVYRKVRAGEMRREEAAVKLQALHDAQASAIRGVLTDEQIAAISARIAARGDGGDAHLQGLRQAMIEALGLRERQVAALDELHRGQCSALQELVDGVRNGRITREEYHGRLERLVGAKVKAYGEILFGEQVEIAQIHDALLVINARRFIHWVTGEPRE